MIYRYCLPPPHETCTHTHAVPVLQWISQLVSSTSGEEPPGSGSPALGSAIPLTAHLQCHPEIAVAAVGMCKLCRCIILIPRFLSGFAAESRGGAWECDWRNLGMRLSTQPPIIVSVIMQAFSSSSQRTCSEVQWTILLTISAAW